MYLADTTFLIDSLRKKTNVQTFLKNNPTEFLFTTEINVFELYLGIYSSKILAKDPELHQKRKNRMEELIQKFQVLPLGRGEIIEAAKLLGKLYRQGKPIDYRDGLVAGIAVFNNIKKILTKNKDHFNRIEELVVIQY